MTEHTITLSLDDLCQQLQLSESFCIELVEYGIVSPGGDHPAQWTFDPDMVCVIQRALRLHSDLGIDWAAIAIVVDLIEEREQLRIENRALRQRLSRFLED